MDPPHGVWVLTRTAPGGERGAGVLVRVPLDAPEPIDASQLRRSPCPSPRPPCRSRRAAWRGIPAPGDLYVTEARGHHLFRVTPEGRVTIFARGGNVLGDGRALVFDAQGRLLVLDHAGRGASRTPRPTLCAICWKRASLPGSGGPLVPRRRDAPASAQPGVRGSLFPPPALRRRRVALPRYSSLAAFPSGDLVASASNGVIDQLRPDGTIARLAQLSGAGPSSPPAPTCCTRSTTWVGGSPGSGPTARSSRSSRGSRGRWRWPCSARAVIVAEDTGRLLRIVAEPQGAPRWNRGRRPPTTRLRRCD